MNQSYNFELVKVIVVPYLDDATTLQIYTV